MFDVNEALMVRFASALAPLVAALLAPMLDKSKIRNEYVDKAGAAVMIGSTVDVVEGMLRSKKLQAKKPGKIVYISVAEIRSMMEDNSTWL